MFMKRGGSGQPPPGSSSTPSSTPPVQPNQIPYDNPPPPSGPPELTEVNEERVLADPTWAENQLHAALTVRAIKWLEFLKQDENQNPQPGQRLVTLDTQVQMFKVVSDWLKTSKKTKESGAEEDKVPGIELMRQAIREEMALVAAKPLAKKPLPAELDESEEAKPPARSKRPGFQPGNNNAAKKEADDRQLHILLARARKAVHEEG